MAHLSSRRRPATLRYLAEATGGFPVVNTNDFAGELKRIDAETSDYYVLGFYSSNPDPAKRTRTLEVKVDRPNVNVDVAPRLFAQDRRASRRRRRRSRQKK